MDTVTEKEMAIEMARNGGIGIIHRFLSIKDQAAAVHAVKRAQTYIITDPITVASTCTVKDIKKISEEKNIHNSKKIQ